MTDPHAIAKITTCTSLDELKALLAGWSSRGVVLTDAQERTALGMRIRLMRIEGKRR